MATLSNTPSWPARIIAYLFLGLICGAGPVMLLIVAGTGMERALFLRSSLRADGVIVGLRVVRPSRPSDQSRSPIFRFNANDGRSFTVVSSIAQSPSPWKQGDAVTVLYQPEHPENAHIDSFVQLWMPQVIVGIVGAAFSAFPLLIFLRRRRGIGSKWRVTLRIDQPPNREDN
jgi:hypothetical protein